MKPAKAPNQQGAHSSAQGQLIEGLWGVRYQVQPAMR